MKLADISNLGHDIEAMEISYLDTIAALQKANARCNGAFSALHRAFTIKDDQFRKMDEVIASRFEENVRIKGLLNAIRMVLPEIEINAQHTIRSIIDAQPVGEKAE